MIVFKGDIIQKKRNKDRNPIETLYASELIGVIVTAHINDSVLWHRPFKNKIKYLAHNILVFLRLI